MAIYYLACFDGFGLFRGLTSDFAGFFGGDILRACGNDLTVWTNGTESTVLNRRHRESSDEKRVLPRINSKHITSVLPVIRPQRTVQVGGGRVHRALKKGSPWDCAALSAQFGLRSGLLRIGQCHSTDPTRPEGIAIALPSAPFGGVDLHEVVFAVVDGLGGPLGFARRVGNQVQRLSKGCEMLDHLSYLIG
jgi:hypothetical protein